jgi:hypothetical protein
MEKLVVAIKDLAGGGGPDCVYRLVITPASKPDFSLALLQDRVNVPQGGRVVVRCSATRTSFGGPIQLEFAGLPPGVTVDGQTVFPDMDASLVTFSSSGKPGDASIASATARSGDPATELARPALVPQTATSRVQPWLREELAVATSPAIPLSTDWDANESTVKRGEKVATQVKIARAGGAEGQVRLKLLTTQIVPKKNVNNQMVDDTAKALRLEAETTIAPDKNETALSIVVPGDLPARTYQLLLEAELLSADGKQVLATAYTLPRKLVVTSQ